MLRCSSATIETHRCVVSARPDTTYRDPREPLFTKNVRVLDRTGPDRCGPSERSFPTSLAAPQNYLARTHQRATLSRVDRVDERSWSTHVLDRAKVDRAFVDAMFGDARQPDPVRCLCGELAVHEIVVTDKPACRFMRPSWNTDQSRSREHNRATRFSPEVCRDRVGSRG